MANTCILGNIIYKFCYWHKLNLVVLILVDKDLKISFHYTILSPCLLIYLRINSSRKFLPDNEKIA